VFRAHGEITDLSLNASLVMRKWLETLLLQSIHIVLGCIDSPSLEVDSRETLEAVFPEAQFHGKPNLVVKVWASLWQQHEQVVAQQVSLGETHTCRVQRFKDSVRVIVVFCGHIDNREPLHDHTLKAMVIQGSILLGLSLGQL
jgi:hypothetical protein